MKNIKLFLTGNRIYFTSLSTMLFAGCILLLFQGKHAAFFPLDAVHPFWLNVFFINYTFMGDGIFALCLAGILFFYSGKRQLAFNILCAFLISFLFIQVFKNLVYASVPRLYFEAGTYVYFHDGISRSADSGLPSGHTSTAFAIATVLALQLKNKKMQLMILAAAVLAGYSRIYLAGHLLQDILSGAAIGCLTGILPVYLTYTSGMFYFPLIKKSIQKRYISR